MRARRHPLPRLCRESKETHGEPMSGGLMSATCPAILPCPTKEDYAMIFDVFYHDANTGKILPYFDRDTARPPDKAPEGTVAHCLRRDTGCSTTVRASPLTYPSTSE